MKQCIRWMSICVMLICAVMLMDGKAYAKETEPLGSVSIHYKHNDNPLDDVTFRVYKIASIIGPADFKTEEKFSGIDVEYENIEDAKYLAKLRGNLENHINLNKLEPDQEFVTDALGEYSADDLDLGLYMLLADKVVVGQELLLSEPILIMVGSKGNPGTPDDKWLYHFDISAKVDGTPEVEYTDITVKKVWENVNESSLKPTEIEVELYENGKLYDTVVLNDENTWSYTWKDLKVLSTWAVVEKTKLEHYTVDYKKEMFDFVITNTYTAPTVEEPYDEPDQEPSQESSQESAPESHEEIHQELPQTSSLALLVSMFSGIGLVCLLLGVLLRTKEEQA